MPAISRLLNGECGGEVEGAVEWSVDVAVVIVSDVNDVSDVRDISDVSDVSDVRDVSDVSDDVCVEAVIVKDWNAEALRQLNWQPYSFKQLFEILLFDASLTSHQSVARKNWLFTSFQWVRSTHSYRNRVHSHSHLAGKELEHHSASRTFH